VGACRQRDGAAEPGRRELHEAQLVGDLVVVVGVEAHLLRVEGVGSVDVGDRNLDQLELPVHV
jgi:hypothetical protein